MKIFKKNTYKHIYLFAIFNFVKKGDAGNIENLFWNLNFHAKSFL